MNIYYRLEDIPPTLRDTVVTIGSFDGVHRGHQKILEQVCRTSRASDVELPRVVVTFEPHPRLVLAAMAAAAGKPPTNDEKLELLTTLAEKAYWIARYGIDHLIVVPFDLAFANQSPEQYIRDFLVAKLHPKHLIIGYDHRFGHRRSGSIEYLQEMSSQYGYQVHEIPAADIDNIKISSTEIRQALRQGDARRATQLLGHTFQLSGEVVYGRQLGRTIGFPTANLDFSQQPHKLIPKLGIYSATVRIDTTTHKGMLYIGQRPTLDDNLAASVEVHIFDFKDNIYGQNISIDVLHFLRQEAKFEDLSALRQQLQRDKVQALSSLRDLKL
jgi:riboflavin kinase/FMN adenylyltransferase